MAEKRKESIYKTKESMDQVSEFDYFEFYLDEADKIAESTDERLTHEEVFTKEREFKRETYITRKEILFKRNLFLSLHLSLYMFQDDYQDMIVNFQALYFCKNYLYLF